MARPLSDGRSDEGTADAVAAATRGSATLDIQTRSDGTALTFRGRLDSWGTAPLWRRALAAARRARGSGLTFDLSDVSGLDTAGAVLLLQAEHAHGAAGGVRGASEPAAAMLERIRVVAPALCPAPPRPPAPPPLLEVLDHLAHKVFDGFGFIGWAAAATVALRRRRRMLRLSELMRHADQAGVRSMPLVLLLGFLIGLILAFQSAIPMKQYGAEIYVASLVSVSLMRELGPLLAAVILAGRTGSAFAAEIGTMKVNEEVDALVTMGIDPMTMLVVPRLLAASVVMPIMTIALLIAGLTGMSVVMISLGYPLAAILNQVETWSTTSDLFGGLFKAFCFGAVVAAIGCRSGLDTGVGPRAVGLSTTRAVVGGIVSTILLDGLFALLFYQLNL